MLRKIKVHINNLFRRMNWTKSRSYKILMRLNQKLFHFREQEQRICYGHKNEDQIFYVIRVRDNAGMFATVRRILRGMKWAEEQGYTPIVDMAEKQLRDTDDSFFKYYVQKNIYSLEEVYQSKNVILSGNEMESPSDFRFCREITAEWINYMHEYIFSHLDFSDAVKERVGRETAIIDNQTLGVFMRGTDYAALKPSYHDRQPEIGEVIEKVREFMKNHTISRIYLVTEDFGIYSLMKEAFGELLYCTGEHYIMDYDGKSYIADYIQDVYEQNMEYITRIVLLSQCRWLIASKASGSLMALYFNNNRYEESYLFAKGFY